VSIADAPIAWARPYTSVCTSSRQPPWLCTTLAPPHRVLFTLKLEQINEGSSPMERDESIRSGVVH
jgi:hypothetical protein